MKRFFRRLFNAFRPGRPEPELAREIAAHVSQLEDEFRRRGMTAADARRAARLAIGGAEQTKELHRDARSFVWLDDARRDVAYAARTFRRTPGFTFVAVVTLALGIGANTAIFSVVNAVLLRPLPYKDSDRLVRIFESVPADGSPSGIPRRSSVIEGNTLAALRSQMRTLSHVGMYGWGATMWLTGPNEVTRLSGLHISPAILPMLGAEPIIGRTFAMSEETPGAGVSVILSYAAWQRYFGGDPNILGQGLAVEPLARALGGAKTYSVVGVMARGFQFPDSQTEFWIPLPIGIRLGRGPAVARLDDGGLDAGGCCGGQCDSAAASRRSACRCRRHFSPEWRSSGAGPIRAR